MDRQWPITRYVDRWWFWNQLRYDHQLAGCWWSPLGRLACWDWLVIRWAHNHIYWWNRWGVCPVSPFILRRIPRVQRTWACPHWWKLCREVPVLHFKSGSKLQRRVIKWVPIQFEKHDRVKSISWHTNWKIESAHRWLGIGILWRLLDGPGWSTSPTLWRGSQSWPWARWSVKRLQKYSQLHFKADRQR